MPKKSKKGSGGANQKNKNPPKPAEDENLASRPEEPQHDQVEQEQQPTKENGETSPSSNVADSVVDDVQTKELESLVAKQKEEIEKLKEQVLKNAEHESANSSSEESEQVRVLKEQLQEAEQAKEDADDRYEDLLGKISHIKATLGEKLKADSQSLENCRQELAESQVREKEHEETIETLQRELITSTKDQDKLYHDMTSLRKEFDEAYNKWQKEKDSLLKEKRSIMDKHDKEKELVQDLEVALQEEKANRDGYSSKMAEMEDQISTQTSFAEQFKKQRDELKQKVDELEKKLSQESKAFKDELETVDKILKQTEQQLKQAVEDVTEKTTQVDTLQAEVARLTPFEKLSSDQAHQVGKLRHEAVILNEHLTKALRTLKQESEDERVSKQLITNLFIPFLQIPRGDSKKYEVLQVISSTLGWDDDVKAQAGLTRGNGAPSGGLTSPKRSMSSNSLATYDETPGATSFISRFAEFLERESSKN